MSYSIAFVANGDKSPFEEVSKTFLEDPLLVFSKVLPRETIDKTFRKYDALFGGTYYNTSLVLWVFLLQCLSDGKSRSCSTAVGRIVAFFLVLGKSLPNTNTGNFCRARKKLSEKALHELMTLVSKNMEIATPKEWLWKGKHHAKLVDGFTATMPDTPKNQARFPQSKTQLPGCGLPIMRVCVILSLATAMVIDAAFAPYKGKGTGEPALLRQMIPAFDPGDIAVFDRCCCTYWLLALLSQAGVQVCTRIHASREVDFRKGKRLGKNDCLVTWKRPQRPKWMSKEEYATIPETITLRMMRYSLIAQGRRTKCVTVVTTLVDPVEYTAEEVAELYGYRWNVELDIRHIKRAMNIDHFRCLSPEMVEREFWVTLLGYNLVRKVMCEAANFAGVLPRRLSFTRTAAHLLELQLWRMQGTFDVQGLLRYLAKLIVPDRPGRYEPRVLKRRKDCYPKMKVPRHKLKQIEMQKLS